MTVAQIVQMFGSSNGKLSTRVRGEYDKGSYDTLIPVIHAIEPNPEAIPGRSDRTNMLYRSVYWEAASPNDEVLEFGGFKNQPFWAPRWDVTGNETYGSSPAMEGLGDMKRIQLKELRYQQAIDVTVKPPLRATPMMQTASIQNFSGGITYGAGPDNQPITPLYEINPDFAALTADKNDARLALREHFYADLFMAISQMEGVQPRNGTEIAERVGEKMTQLGPVVERVENEKLRPAIDCAFNILLNAGALPPAPPELHGQPLNIEFVSILSQMQRASTLTAIERLVAFGNSQAEFTPEVQDKINHDEAMDQYGDILGVPADIVRSDDDVAKVRQQRQAAAQQQQMAEAAGPTSQYADAVKKLSESQIGQGRNALENMIQGQSQGPAQQYPV
jgi:hypothetical protein